MAAHKKHREAAPKTLKVSIITVSTSRYLEASKGGKVIDESGSKAEEMILSSGHKITSKKIVNDEAEMIRLELLRSIYDEEADVVVLTGGTGSASRDVTVEAIKPLLDKTLEGFGEVFRSVTYQKIGSPAILTRTLAGIIGGKVIFCLPGSPDAVETGLNLILPELSHTVYVARA